MDLVYVAGPPAAGKSTLVAALTAGCGRRLTLAPFAHDVLTPAGPVPDGWTGVELGRRRERFAGTDALPLNVQPRALTWLPTAAHTLILAEGDRLANLTFLVTARHAGYTVTLLVLDAPWTLLDERCAARGSRQSAAWRAGRATKTSRLTARAEAAGLTVRTLDARQPVGALVRAALAAAPALHTLQPPPPEQEPHP